MFSLRSQTPSNPVIGIIEEHPLASLAGAWLIGLAAVRLVRPALMAGVALAATQAAKKTFASMMPSRANGAARKRPAKLRASGAKRKGRKASPVRKRAKKAQDSSKSADTVH
jgi:hypothetical protein